MGNVDCLGQIRTLDTEQPNLLLPGAFLGTVRVRLGCLPLAKQKLR